MKETDFLVERFSDNFIYYQDFHADYLNDILVFIEKDFNDFVAGNEYSDCDTKFNADDFITIFYDFCKKMEIDSVAEKIINERRIFSITRGGGYDNYLGLTLFNPISGNTNVLIDDFGTDLDSLFVLIHEMGHVYDLGELWKNNTISQYIDCRYKSIYQEVISRLFERVFLSYLIENKIMVDGAIDRLIDMEIGNYNYIFTTYVLSLLDMRYLKNENYLNMGEEDLYRLVKKYFITSFEEFSENLEDVNLHDDLNYCYGDIISLFLKDEVLEEGLNGELFRKFMETRYLEFTDRFIVSEELEPDKYSKLYRKEIQMIKDWKTR